MSQRPCNTSTGNGAARRRAAASLSSGRARPSNGSDSQPQLDYPFEHMSSCGTCVLRICMYSCARASLVMSAVPI
eukprot:761412-Pleurochrysis_carterae.AAC.1